MTEPARVKVEYAFKVNLGDYENVEIRIGVEDSAREGETVKSAFDRIDKFVSERVNNEVAEARTLRTN